MMDERSTPTGSPFPEIRYQGLFAGERVFRVAAARGDWGAPPKSWSIDDRCPKCAGSLSPGLITNLPGDPTDVPFDQAIAVDGLGCESCRVLVYPRDLSQGTITEMMDVARSYRAATRLREAGCWFLRARSNAPGNFDAQEGLAEAILAGARDQPGAAAQESSLKHARREYQRALSLCRTAGLAVETSARLVLVLAALDLERGELEGTMGYLNQLGAAVPRDLWPPIAMALWTRVEEALSCTRLVASQLLPFLELSWIPTERPQCARELETFLHGISELERLMLREPRFAEPWRLYALSMQLVYGEAALPAFARAYQQHSTDLRVASDYCRALLHFERRADALAIAYRNHQCFAGHARITCDLSIAQLLNDDMRGAVVTSMNAAAALSPTYRLQAPLRVLLSRYAAGECPPATLSCLWRALATVQLDTPLGLSPHAGRD